MMNFLRKQMKWVMAIIVVAFLLSTFLMYEGGSARRTPSKNADGTMSDYEVAQINGRSFMRSELEQRLRSYLGTLSTRNTESLDMGAIYKTVLDQAVLESQLLKEIDEQGIKISDAEAEQAMKNYADTYYPTRETFYEALKQSGVKLEDYKRNLARQIAVDRLMTRAIGEIEISEDKAVEFYDSMKNLFYTKPEGFMVHMADFNTSADAEAFRAKIVAGESWDVLASEDKADNVINITKNPVFLPANALRIGTLNVLASIDILEPSEVFSVSSSDFAVGMKTSHVESTTSPYDEVSEDIKTLLTQEEQRKRLAEYEQTLKTKANLVINDAELFTSKATSKDEQSEPEFIIEEVSEDVTSEDENEEEEIIDAETKSEDVETVEEPKSEDEKPVEAVEEVKEPVAVEEAKSEDEKPVEAVEEVKEPVTVEEPKSEDEKPVEAVEEVKEPVAVEEPKSEDEKPVEAVEEVKEPVTVEEVKSEDEKPVEAVEEVKEPVSVEEAKSEDEKPVEAVEKVKEPVTVEEAKSEDVPAAVVEEAKNVTENLINEVKEAVIEITESKDIPLQEEVKEN